MNERKMESSLRRFEQRKYSFKYLGIGKMLFLVQSVSEMKISGNIPIGKKKRKTDNERNRENRKEDIRHCASHMKQIHQIRKS
jgi:hypothetical protein